MPEGRSSRPELKSISSTIQDEDVFHRDGKDELGDDVHASAAENGGAHPQKTGVASIFKHVMHLPDSLRGGITSAEKRLSSMATHEQPVMKR